MPKYVFWGLGRGSISVRVHLSLYSLHTKLTSRGFSQYSVIALRKSCAGRDITVCGEQGDNEYRMSASLNFNAKRFWVTIVKYLDFAPCLIFKNANTAFRSCIFFRRRCIGGEAPTEMGWKNVSVPKRTGCTEYLPVSDDMILAHSHDNRHVLV